MTYTQIEEPTSKLLKAISNVMKAVSYLKKDDTVGSGSYSYKGISDEKVKETLRVSMIENGLIIVPEVIDQKSSTERWEENNKTKQQIFTDCVVTFRIYHVSGASITGQSFGHGIDNQDKGPGKAMTYAMKYFMLNTFMIPTGDDPDKIHSNDTPVPAAKKTNVKSEYEPPVEVTLPKFPTALEIDSMLFGGSGILSNDAMSGGAVTNWLNHGGALLYGCYIYTVKADKFSYFKLDEWQVKKIAKDVKFKHG